MVTERTEICFKMSRRDKRTENTVKANAKKRRLQVSYDLEIANYL
jgi:hypothetical protein